MPFVQRRPLTLAGFALCYCSIDFGPTSCLFELLQGRGQTTLCVSDWEASPGPPSTGGQAQGPRSPVCPSRTFCLSSQELRQAWRIACGMACSLLFPACVVTSMQTWQSDS